jgi:16S rRNA processing protein RimM
VTRAADRRENPDLFAVGRITGCHGLKGYLKIRLTTRSPDRLKGLGSVLLGESPGVCAPFEIEDVRTGGRNTLVKFSGVSDRTSAEPLVGRYLFVEEARSAKPGTGSYFIHDIIGCSVVTADGTIVGEVEEVYKFPAQDVWAVRRGTALEMIPAVKEFIQDVDLRHRKIVVRLIEGLLGGT